MNNFSDGCVFENCKKKPVWMGIPDYPLFNYHDCKGTLFYCSKHQKYQERNNIGAWIGFIKISDLRKRLK